MKNIYFPGECICEAEGYIRGHGTQEEGNTIVSTYFGKKNIINKLITIEPAFPLRYSPEIGDVVVGRIIEIFNKKWRVETNSRFETSLSLSAINLPGVVQRRKLESDEIQMRSFFNINDVIVAEIQKINKNGSATLHTRSNKYKRLSKGTMISVPISLIPPLKSRFIENNDIEIIVGMNGYIWVGCNKIEQNSVRQISNIISKINQCIYTSIIIDFENILE